MILAYCTHNGLTGEFLLRSQLNLVGIYLWTRSGPNSSMGDAARDMNT